MMILINSRKLALSAFLLAMPLHAAQAQDANAVADRIKQLLAARNTDIKWQTAAGDTSKLVLESVTIGTPGQQERISIGNLTLEGIHEENGGYRIDTITSEPYHFTKNEASIDVSSAVLSGLVLPQPDPDNPLTSITSYDSFALGSFDLKRDGTPLVSLSNLTGEVTPSKDGSPIEFTATVEEFTLDLGNTVQDPKAKAAIEGLGYQNISGNVELAGSWQPSDGHFMLTQYDTTVDDAGTLGLTLDLGGYTPEFLKSLQELQKQMAAQPEGADKSAQGLAMLGLMQQLTLKGGSLRFDDDSLTGKALDYAAKQQGVKPGDIANQAKAIVPFLTSQLNNPELSGQITAAVNKFLDDPQNIEVKLSPASAVPLALIAANAIGNPLELPKTLGATVLANEN